MKGAALVLVVLALLLSNVGQARAGLPSPHGEGTISGLYYAPQGFGQTVDGDTIVLQNSRSPSINNGNQSASAIVHTNPSPQFLGGQASSTQLQITGGFGGDAGGLDAKKLRRPQPGLGGAAAVGEKKPCRKTRAANRLKRDEKKPRAARPVCPAARV
jgi:hypothetical protein